MPKHRHAAILLLCLSTALPLLAAWEPDVRLTNSQPGQGPSTFAPRWLAATGDYVHVVWGDSRNPSLDVFHLRSTDGGTTWGTAFNLADTIAVSEFPAVAASGMHAYAVWTDDRDGNEEIYFRASADAGATWGSAVRLTADDALSHPPTTAAWGEHVYVLWVDGRTPTGAQVFIKRSTDGGATWSQDAELPNQDAGAISPSVTADDSMVHAVWSDAREGIYKVYYKRSFDHGLTWSADVALTGVLGYFPSIGVSGMDVHVAWNSIESEVIYRGSTDGGVTWSPERQVSASGDGSTFPTVVCSGPLVHVAWHEDRYAGTSELAYRRSVNHGVTWENEVRLTTADGASTIPCLAAAGPAVHVVWWDTRDLVPGEVYYKRNPDGNIYGIAESRPAPATGSTVTVRPNPFTRAASVPGRENERFVIHDLAGQRLGEYRGGRIGANLGPGVYFLRDDYGRSVATVVKTD
ncbi:exo-alpha-sialidase [candidate division WOR-3 bacterium]|nr:exo-alpha-sialidase [candidate division WOR-3 bacterium]